MSIKGPKPKDGEGKKVEPQTREKGRSKKRPDELTGVRPEPIFQIDPNDLSKQTLIESTRTDLKQQIGQLKEQVESISLESPDALTADQSDVLKKYIALKETENRDLREQLRQYQSFLKRVNQQVEAAEGRNRDHLTEIESLRRREENERHQLRDLKEKQLAQLDALKVEYEEKLRQSGNYESEAAALSQKRELWQERVKQDLNRIKLKEKELENRYELLKRDMQALLDSKDKHVLELKKRSDAQDLELESLEERLRKANQTIAGMDGKKRRLIETLKLALSLLETLDQVTEEDNVGLDSPAGGKRRAG